MLRRFAIPLIGVVMIGLTVGYLLLGQPQKSLPEGGVAKSMQAPTQTAKLAPVTQDPAATAQLIAVAASKCAGNSGKTLLVSIGQQHLWACDGQSLVKESAVTTGASGLTNVDNATPTGTWHIYAKYTNTTLKGCDVNGCWNDPVAYWMPFDDQVGFHDASWQTFPFGSSQYTTQGSHGCVHLPTDIAGWVYSWAPIGTTVTVAS